MDDTQLCLDTSVLIAYLKGREPGAAAVEKAVKEYACHVTAITVYELLFWGGPRPKGNWRASAFGGDDSDTLHRGSRPTRSQFTRRFD